SNAPGCPLGPARRGLAPARCLQAPLHQPVVFKTPPQPFSERIGGMDTFPDPLAAEPVVLTEIRIGYARISTREQKLDRQMDALTAAGCRRIFAATQSRRTDDGPQLMACPAALNPCHTLA